MPPVEHPARRRTGLKGGHSYRVVDLRSGFPNATPAALPDAQKKVDVVEVHEEGSVPSAGFEVHLAVNQNGASATEGNRFAAGKRGAELERPRRVAADGIEEGAA